MGIGSGAILVTAGFGLIGTGATIDALGDSPRPQEAVVSHLDQAHFELFPSELHSFRVGSSMAYVEVPAAPHISAAKQELQSATRNLSETNIDTQCLDEILAAPAFNRSRASECILRVLDDLENDNTAEPAPPVVNVGLALGALGLIALAVEAPEYR